MPETRPFTSPETVSPGEYYKRNFSVLQRPDAEILSLRAETHQTMAAGKPGELGSAVMFGVLSAVPYVVAAMPWFAELHVTDPSNRAREWWTGLIESARSSEQHRQILVDMIHPTADLLAPISQAYETQGLLEMLLDPTKIRIGEADIFDPSTIPSGVGTAFMDCVACSISTDLRVFKRAIAGFVQSVPPGGSLFATFIQHRDGGWTDTSGPGGAWRPAVKFDFADVVEGIQRAGGVMSVQYSESQLIRDSEDTSRLILAQGYRL
jgi:hypothetical protein